MRVSGHGHLLLVGAVGTAAALTALLAAPDLGHAQRREGRQDARSATVTLKVRNAAACELTTTFFGDGIGANGKKIKLKAGKDKNLKLKGPGTVYTWTATGNCCLVGAGELTAPVSRTGNAPLVIACVPSLAAPLGLTSAAFVDGGTLPTEYTCDGSGSSPPLAIQNVPAGTMSFVVILDDPDAPGGFSHWVLFDIPAGQATLPSGFQPGDYGASALNDAGSTGYFSACAPRGDDPHRYIFKLFALDVATLNLPEGSSRAAVEQAMKGRVLGESQLVATFVRG